jgi:outer membrane protein assembly factor BamB
LLCFGLGGICATSPGMAEVASPVAMFRNSLDHAGVFSDTGTGLYSGVLWRKQTAGSVRSSPIVVDGVLLVGSSDGYFYALDAETGNEKWKFAADSAVASSAAVANGRVFFSSYKGTFYAVSFAAGRLLWKARFGPDMQRADQLAVGPRPATFDGDFILSSAAVLNDTVVVGGGDGLVYAFNAKTGRLHWKFRTDGRVRSSPAISNGVVFVGSYDGSLYAIDFESGRLIWRFDTKGRSINSANYGFDRRAILASPAVSDGVVYIGSRDARLYAVDAATGTLKWTFDYRKDDATWVLSSVAIQAPVVFEGTADGYFVHALNAGDGSELWRFKMPNRVWSSPVVAGSVLYVGNQSGGLYAIDLATGKERWQFQTQAAILSTPAIANGTVYFGSNDGGIYAVRIDGERELQRAVYFDQKSSDILEAAGSQIKTADQAALRDFFQARGYDVIGSTTLADWLAKRIADGSPSVIVTATSTLPDSVVGTSPDRGLFRQYLNAGGKVVWVGNPPTLRELIFDKDNHVVDMAVHWDAAGSLLGISYRGALQDEVSNNRVTVAGRAWDLPDWWIGFWGIPITNEITAFSIDDSGLAGAWFKSFGGAPGTGFVYVGLTQWDTEWLNRLAMVAEYRPRR